jgi:hypothetical protein
VIEALFKLQLDLDIGIVDCGKGIVEYIPIKRLYSIVLEPPS